MSIVGERVGERSALRQNPHVKSPESALDRVVPASNLQEEQVNTSILELEAKPELEQVPAPAAAAPKPASVRKPPLPALTGIRTLLAIFIILFHFTPVTASLVSSS
jgi:hypothetical protein